MPNFTPGQHCPVTLPSRGPVGGWKAGTQEEWDTVFRYKREKDECCLKRQDWKELKKLHMDAHYGSGDVMRGCTSVKDTIDMFIENGLACTPWREGRHFWGLKNTKERGLARMVKPLNDEAQRSHEDWFERLIDELNEDPDADLSHQASYNLEACKAVLREAVGRGDIEIPSNLHELRNLLGTMLDASGVCPDCLIEKFLIILEHAKAGPDAGKVRSRDCKVCNEAGRAHTDVVVDAAQKLGETLTAAFHARLAELPIAHARPGQATRDAKALLARARRLAAGATVEEDERALAHVSTTRGRAADDTYQARRAAAIAEEATRRAEINERDRATAAQRAALPPVKPGTRVVVIDEDSRDHGRRGVVQGFRGQTYIAVRLGRDPSDRCFYRRQLRIETPRKPAAKPAAKKPSKKKARK